MSNAKVKREYKGKNLLEFPNSYVVIDIETTGFDPTYDQIIELSAVKYENSKEIDSYSQLVNPETPINDYICNLTGLSTSMLSSKPKLQDILQNYLDFIGNSILIGQNVNFDINFLYDASMRIFNKPLCNNFIDTMRIAKRLYPDMLHHRLDDLINLYNLTKREEHRAFNDCQLTNQIFLCEKKDVFHKYDDIEQFQRKKSSSNHYKLHASDITVDSGIEFDETHPLFGKLCVFTGTLDHMVRKEAMQQVVNLGGYVGDSITKKTNFLILGNNDYCQSIKDGKSNKQKKAESNKLKGQDIEIISENVFYDMLDM